MAQVDSSNNPNDPNNPNAPGAASNQGPQGTNQPATSGGAGAVTSTGAANVTGNVTGTAQPSQPFQNIASYLAANAPQSEKLASQVAGTVSAPITQATGDIASAADTFNQSVNAGYAPEKPDVIAGVASNPNAVVAQGPQSIADWLSNFQDSYKGPTDFTTSPGYANLEAEVAAANAAAANTKTQPGVQTLLQQTEGPTTAGINNLDALLLNLNPGNLKTIQDAAVGAPALSPALASATTTGNANAQTAQSAAQKAQADAQAAFGTATGNLTTGVNTKLNDAMTQYEQAQQQLNKYIAGIAQPGLSGLKVADLIRAGVDPAVIQAYTGLPTVTTEMLSNWSGLPDLGNAPGSTEWKLPAATALPSAASVATPEDYQTLSALMQLSGGTPFTAPINASDASQAGTFSVGKSTPTPDNKALAQDLYNYLMGWSAPKGISPTQQGQNGGAQSAIGDYASEMNAIAAYLGLPAFNANYPTPPPPPPPGGGGPPFLGI
jgi:hypothetical protein